MFKALSRIVARPKNSRKPRLSLQALEDRRILSATSFEVEKLCECPEEAPAIVQDITAPPTLTKVTFGDGTAQRSQVRQLVLNFSAPVKFGAMESAITLHHQGAEIGDNVELVVEPIEDMATSITVHFAGKYADERGSLINGYYDLSLNSGDVVGFNGKLDGDADGEEGGDFALSGSAENGLYRLLGDANGDAKVTWADGIALRNAFYTSSDAFDFDNDGIVGQSDIMMFRNLFNTTP